MPGTTHWVGDGCIPAHPEIGGLPTASEAVEETVTTTDGDLANSIIRKMASNWGGCIMIENGQGLIDSGWTKLTPEELAYLDKVWKECGE